MSPFENLAKIFQHEQRLGYTNSGVIGGLENFVANWAQRNPSGDDPGHSERVNQIVESLLGYGAADATARQVMLERALALTREAPSSGSSRKRRAEVTSPPEERHANRSRTTSKSATPTSATPASSAAMEVVGPAAEMPTPEIEAAEEDEEEELPPPPARDFSFGLEAPVLRLQGVGAAHAKRLENLGVRTVQDLLYFFPRRYDDYRNLKTISALMYGEEVTIIAKVSTVNTRSARGNLNITNVLLVDQTGSINANFYNQPFLSKQLRPGTQIVVHGKVDRYLNRLCFSHPEWERPSKNAVGIQPVYPLTEGITSRWMRNLARGVVHYWADKVPDPLPKALKQRAHLVDLSEALHEIHFPTDEQKLERARRRLAFEEFLLIQIGVLRQRRKWRNEPGKALRVEPEFLDKFLASLPYQLTGAQKRSLNDILGDVQQTAPMSRLLQGDVGSGKTVVATAVMLIAVANGMQAVLMAPTEILAEQHYKTINKILDGLNGQLGFTPRVELLIGSMRPSQKAEVQERIAAGQVDMAIGTHALIQEAVNFPRLAFAVIDEQHRFGVTQRAAIRQKGYNPHILVMSATPIPRTLALTVYGDLDLSILDEMPPGRQEIRTKWLEPRERERAYAFIRKQVQEGRQAFVICPLIEESEAIDAKAAVEEYERLRKEVYPDLRVGLIHGKLKPAEKDAAMTAFRDREIDVLVATSVVEVGIDVPNATVMLIEGADRFGLAQLHQFRGRVGRGEHQSYCMLLAEKSGSTSDERLKVIEETQDGFKLAEADLMLRGPGEFFGTRQSGLPDLRVAKLSDVKLLEEARRVAQEIFEQDPDLKAPEYQLLKQKVFQFWHGEGDLS